MQSPFKIFRKHQKIVLAGLTLMAMIGFGLGDVLQKMGRSGGSQQATRDVVETNVGGLSQMELSHLRMQRTSLHRFIEAAYEVSHPEHKHPAVLRYYAQMAAAQFGFGGLTQEGLLYSWLHRYEARKMGIVVSDPQIRDYIKRFTNNKLSTARFSEILERMRLSPKELFDMFREELQGDIARKMKVPAYLPSPEKYWEYYQQLNTREKIEVAALPVLDFAADIPDPAEKQIAALFEQHKADFERAANGEFRPGFRQPRRLKLHYLTINASAVEDKLALSGPVTDKEIEDYYEKNKDKDTRLYEFEAPAPDETAPIDPEFAPEKGPALDSDAPKSKPQDQPKETPEKANDASEPSDEDAKPQAKDGDDASGNEGKAPSTKGSDCSSVADENEETKPAAKAGSEKPTGERAKKKEAGGRQAARTAGDSEYTPDPPPLPEGDDEKAGAEGPKISGRKEPPKIKYKPLDDNLREQIRDSVLNDRRQKLLQAETNKAVEAVRDLGLKLSTSPDVKLSDPNPEEVKTIERRSEEGLRKIAADLGMKFSKTDLVSQVELSEIPGLGKAFEFGAADTPRSEITTIVEQAFGTEALCRHFVSEAPNGTIYVGWKVNDSAEHIPTLGEPGIREEVVKAWKRIEALPVAKKRAAELAERVRQKHNDLGAALGKETVTGDSKGLAVTISESPEFSFYSESSAPDPMRQRAVVQLGNPIVVSRPGPKFMRVAFDEIDEGQVGIALNDDASVYYVVKVLSRRPADRADFEKANDKLFGQASPYMEVAYLEVREAVAEYTRRMDEKYAVKWNASPAREMFNPAYDEE
jgi:hypothetical protein